MSIEIICKDYESKSQNSTSDDINQNINMLIIDVLYFAILLARVLIYDSKKVLNRLWILKLQRQQVNENSMFF